jgi:hypothetical protein
VAVPQAETKFVLPSQLERVRGDGGEIDGGHAASGLFSGPL